MFDRIDEEPKGAQQDFYSSCTMSIASLSAGHIELGDEPS
jgi:hypothetical protein